MFSVVIAGWESTSSASASRTEVQKPLEKVVLALPHRHRFSAFVVLYPLRDVALLFREHGPRVYGYKRDRHSSIAYAVASPDELTGDRVDVTFPHIGRIRGRFVADGQRSRGRHKPFCRGPAPIRESGHLIGETHLRGDGFRPLRIRRSEMEISRSFELQCKSGHAENPPKRDLFAYIGGESGFTFSGNSEAVLLFEDDAPRRVNRLVATRDYGGDATFTAKTLEVLPGRVAAIRRVDLEHVAVAAFAVDPPKLHPARAVIRPPFPFSGTGVYRRAAGSIRGDLSVHFPGRTVRFGSKRSEAGLLVPH